MPLTPTPGTALTEPMGLGVIGVAANGVPIYGAQESGGTNAVEPTGSITDAQYWWGHAATAGLHVTLRHPVAVGDATSPPGSRQSGPLACPLRCSRA